MADETVLLVTHPARVAAIHYYTAATGFLVAGLGILLTLIRLPSLDFVPSVWLSAGVGLFLVTLSLLLILRVEVRRISLTFVLTSTRVVRREGIVRRRTKYMPYAKLERVEIMQSLRGRLVDIGTLVVSAGEETLTVGSVRHPAELERMISSHTVRR